ncbi:MULTISPECIES: DMT family transporter [Clostridium]|uniref:Smr family multidrug resistance protein n=2 Tax=Clostridium TaxID=1485 RepID=A0A0E3JYW9_CLOSL|nr:MULTISPECIES: multidrug efflux SMR transporter [Clostridium]AKA69349.1 Smr family multidrug resistance protein [Clostridium scatologenes]AWI04527.1 QacE family quaternary ammonium compound efflux SMR transporter [Clostridium drakei]
MEWIYLILAILFEIAGTTLMKVSYGFTKILPTIGTFLGYIICFICLSMALKKIDISVAYAIWSAAGLVILSTIGIFVFKESISVLKVVSLAFIVLGVIGLNLSGVSH